MRLARRLPGELEMASAPDTETRKAWKAESQSLIGKMRLWLVFGHATGLLILLGAITQGAVSLNVYSQALGVLFIVGATCAFTANYFTALALRGWGTANYDIGNRMSGFSDVGLYVAAALLLIGMTAPLFLPVLNAPTTPASVETAKLSQPVATSPSSNEQVDAAAPAPITTPITEAQPPAAPAPAATPNLEQLAPPATATQ